MPNPCFACYLIHFVDILCSNITLFHESVSNNTMRHTCARSPRAHAEFLPNPLVFQHFQHRMSIKHMKTYDFLIQKVSKICPRALAESLKNHWFLIIPVKVAFTGNFSRARRTNSTSSALLPEAPSLSNNTMRRTCARPPRAHVEIHPNPLVFFSRISTSHANKNV